MFTSKLKPYRPLLSLMLLLSLSTPAWADNPPTNVPAGQHTQALQRAMKAYAGQIIGLEHKQRQGNTYYEITLLSPQGHRFKLMYDAQTGTLTKKEQDPDDDAAKLKQVNVMPLADLLKQAGITRLLDIELDSHNGQLRYEVKWLDEQGRSQEGHFDAQTGRPLKR
ncbi:MAG: PepSY domain-containing protein [Candidatus Sericytochromatia bacterium]|nr:PepSY domain-containing protein [Candidatus Sericytochromatia bacterium]